ncbi:hypothetical protein BDA99DRAFT_565788 [Phascolomyces articulosus]|uniref:Uncharacterized protein n=1 Tax=Phascolomyces articulosus TaxID=60185 RepID=A0AAD5JM25_9FUNG|nr:hypothetical protein BDA99DRAFT_565788 [Phascolomyces articulosus]
MGVRNFASELLNESEAASQEHLNQHRREVQQQQSEATQEYIGIKVLENPSEVDSEPITGYHTLKGHDSLEAIARLMAWLDMNFKERNLQAKSDILKLPTGMTVEMMKVFHLIAAKAKNGKLEARKLICNKKLEVFDSGENDNESMQILDIVDVIIASLHIIDIGETYGKATKIAIQYNMELCKDKDNNQVVIGRRINLLFNTLGVELGSSEWKKASVPGILGKQLCNNKTKMLKPIKLSYAYHRQNALSTFRKYRATSMEKLSPPSLDTFFTLVKKQRKTKTIVINGDNDDIYIESYLE